MNQFRKEQIVDKDNVTKAELSALNPNSNIFLTKDGQATIINPVWLFNDGSGSIASDENNTYDLNLFGSPTWGSGYLQLDGTDNQYFDSPDGFLYDLPSDSFSVILWYQWNSTPGNFKHYFLLGRGGTNNSDYSFTITTRSGGVPSVITSDGINVTVLQTAVAPTANIKTLLILTYQRNGGANDNGLTLRWTQNGSTWREINSSTTGLIQVNPDFEIKSKITTNSGQSGRYYKAEIKKGVVLDNTQMQAIWSAGSE